MEIRPNAFEDALIYYFAERIRTKRRRGDASQQALAEVTDLSQATISRVENAKAPLPLTADVYDALITSGLVEQRSPGGAYRVGRPRKNA
jgi:DNA-binding XRE family transcriptional regulator